MSVKTFQRGVFLPHYKEFSEGEPVSVISLPQEVIIPMQQHIGAPNKPLVAVGDQIKAGQKIGEGSAFVNAAVHASVDGTVTAVEARPTFTGGSAECVVIAVDPDQTEPQWPEQDHSVLTKDEIKAAIKEAGIVGMGGAAFPTHVKLSPPVPIDTIVINACECEPFLTCDHRAMLERTSELIEGAKLIAKTVDAPNVVFGVEINKPDAIEALEKMIVDDTGVSVVPLEVKYPQGSEKQLIKATLNREVPPGKLPMEVSVVVQNVATALAVYEACRYKKPLIERVLTLSGDAAANPGNLRVKLGTPISHVLRERGGIKGAPAAENGEVPLPPELVGKIIMGGPMTGWAQSHLNSPVVKGTSGILLFTPSMVAQTGHTDCVRCGKCVDHCPMFLYPNYIGQYAEKGDFDEAAAWGAMDCFECGICVYVCPANRPMVEYVRQTKREMAAKRAAAAK